MLKTIAWISLGAALCWAPLVGSCADGLRRQTGRPVDLDFRPVVEPRQRKQGPGES